MKQAGGTRRVWLVALAAVVGLSACKDNGLREGTNRPLDQSRNSESPYPVYEAAPETAPVTVGGRSYMGSSPIERIAAARLEPVGSVGGVTLYAVRGSSAPYPRLYAPVGAAGTDQWQPYLRLN